MPYYHVLLSFQDEPDTVRCLFADLSERELETQFLEPYRRGKNLLSKSGEVVYVSRIKIVKIRRTSDTSDAALKRIQEERRKKTDELNRSSRVVFLDTHSYTLDDIGEAGEDVTRRFIRGAPGHGDRWTAVVALLNNPWILTIGGSVIVGLLIWLLRLNR